MSSPSAQQHLRNYFSKDKPTSKPKPEGRNELEVFTAIGKEMRPPQKSPKDAKLQKRHAHPLRLYSASWAFR